MAKVRYELTRKELLDTLCDSDWVKDLCDDTLYDLLENGFKGVNNLTNTELRDFIEEHDLDAYITDNLEFEDVEHEFDNVVIVDTPKKAAAKKKK